MTKPRSSSVRYVSTSDVTDPDNYFKQLFLGHPQPTRQDRRARDIALDYHRKCERYDQAVCSKRDDRGYGRPSGGEETHLINVYAKEMREQAEEDARREGIPLSKLHAAIRVVGREIDRGITSV